VGRRRLPDVLRYLRALELRLDKLPEAPQRDRERMETVQRLQQAYLRLLPEHAGRPELQRIRWMLEELRVNLFAVSVGTPGPVSEQRILRAMRELR
jgi:ATP-dependent helicase HrpA